MLRFFETSLDPFRDHDESMPPASLIGYYGRYCKHVWPFLVALMTTSLVVSLIEVTILRFVGALVDMLRSTSPDEVLETHGGEFLAIALLILIGRPLASFTHDLIVQQAIAPGMTNLIRWQTHRYVLRQSVSYFANDFAGRIASNIVQAAASLRDSVVQIIDSLWFVTVFAFSALFIFAQTDWRLACPLIRWILFYVSALFYFVPRIRRRSEALAHMRATLTGRIVDSYTNIQTVKLFAHLEREDEHARDALADHTAAFHRQTRLITFLNLTVSVSNSILLVSVGALAGLALGTRRRVAGRHRRCDRARDPRRPHVGLGDVDLDRHLRQYRTGPGGDANDRAATRAGRSRRRPPAHGFQGRHPVRERPVPLRQGARRYRRLLACDRAGRKGRSSRAFRGRKSTLVNLLLRFYDVEGGRILIDGQDIALATQESLRQQIGMVTQDTSLLHRSIGENIHYGRPDATDEAVIAAARQAHAHDFVMSLIDPDGRKGYDTLSASAGSNCPEASANGSLSHGSC